jgi:hypothetical protein
MYFSREILATGTPDLSNFELVEPILISKKVHSGADKRAVADAVAYSSKDVGYKSEESFHRSS